MILTIDVSGCGTLSNFQTYLYFHGPLTNFPPSQIAQCQQWYNSYHGYMKVNWFLFCMRQLSCGGWWLSGCRGSVAEHWQFKPEVPWVRLLATAGLFTFLFFRLITSKFIFSSMRPDALSSCLYLSVAPTQLMRLTMS